jgi:two-component system chemotaxis response regulator CheY
MPDNSLAHHSYLIVDDEPFSRDIVRRMIAETNPRHIDTAESGTEALALLRRDDAEYDCVITDFNMEPINGLDLLKAIRVGTERVPRDLPVIMLTGHSDAELVGTAIALDAHAFLAKPVSFNTLCERLVRVLADPASVRPAIAYSVIPTASRRPGAPESREQGKSFALQSEFEDAKATGTAKPAEPKRRERQLSLSETPANSVLSRAFTTKNGTVLLGADSVLTLRMLNRLRDVTALETVVDKVWIFVEEAAG